MDRRTGRIEGCQIVTRCGEASCRSGRNAGGGIRTDRGLHVPSRVIALPRANVPRRRLYSHFGPALQGRQDNFNGSPEDLSTCLIAAAQSMFGRVQRFRAALPLAAQVQSPLASGTPSPSVRVRRLPAPRGQGAVLAWVSCGVFPAHVAHSRECRRYPPRCGRLCRHSGDFAASGSPGRSGF
jgi:hypothetical protein